MHCCLLPKVWLSCNLCNTILQQHIHSNTVDNKRFFVRTLQNMNILSHIDDSNSYLDNDLIVHTLTDNSVDHTDFNLDKE